MAKVITGYSQEFKGKVLARYVTGASSFALSKEFGITSGTIEKWASDAGIHRGTTISPDAREEIGYLLFEHIKKSLLAMSRVVDLTENQSWIEKQTAGDLALMYTTVHERTTHLLASLQASAQGDPTQLTDDHPDYLDAEAIGGDGMVHSHFEEQRTEN